MIASTTFETLTAYNTLIVLAGTMLLGIAAGLTGTFMLLRRRALAGDVIGHAALPGVAIAFLIYASIYPDSGKHLPTMLLGGAIASGSAMLVVMWLRRVAKLPEDAVLAIVLSTFFGAGIVLISVAQAPGIGSPSGLKSFIFGQAAALRQNDVLLLAGIAGTAIVASTLLVKEWTLMCFDEGLCMVLGYPVWLLDLLLMTLVVCVCVAGMQSAGLLLIVGMLVIPPSAARFWSDSIYPNLWISALFGALSAMLGGIASALIPKLSTGAVMIVAAACLLGVSVLVGRRHGLLYRWIEQRRLAIDDSVM